jgi:hypothetical protein
MKIEAKTDSSSLGLAVLVGSDLAYLIALISLIVAIVRQITYHQPRFDADPQ